MLSAGEPAYVVQRRLGHAKVEMTLGIAAHVLPSMQQDAAAKLSSLLHGQVFRRCGRDVCRDTLPVSG